MKLGAIFALVSIVPLAFLTYFSISLASDAVRRDAKERMSLTAALSAEGVRQEMQGLKESSSHMRSGRRSLRRCKTAGRRRARPPCCAVISAS